LLRDDERTCHLPKLIKDLVLRLNSRVAGSPQDIDAACPPSYTAKGELDQMPET
jgi:hypothetical protein